MMNSKLKPIMIGFSSVLLFSAVAIDIDVIYFKVSNQKSIRVVNHGVSSQEKDSTKVIQDNSGGLTLRP